MWNAMGSGDANDPIFLGDSDSDSTPGAMVDFATPLAMPRAAKRKQGVSPDRGGPAEPTGGLEAKKARVTGTQRQPLSVDELIEFIKGGKQTNLLFTFGPGGAAGMRNVVGQGWEYANVALPAGLPTPQKATQSHIAPGAKPGFGENSGMIDDYNGARVATGVLLENDAVGRLLRTAYGSNFCLADDRGHYRNKKLDYDISDAGRKKLVAGGHIDFPTWQKRDISDVPVQSAQWGDNELCIIALHQCEKHGIPVGGHTLRDQKEMVVGWFVSPLGKKQYKAYCAATVERLTRESTGRARPYAWPQLQQLLTLPPDKLPQYLFAAAIAFGLRPILYPSGKVVDVPQPYCGAVYKHFDNYKPKPGTQTIDPDAEIAALQPELQEYFATVHAALPEEKFACRVSTLSPEYLRRTFGISLVPA